MPRMHILTASEQEAFDNPPLLDHRERKKFFEFPKASMEIAHSVRSPGHRLGFLVSCGYFRRPGDFMRPRTLGPAILLSSPTSLG